MNPNDILDYAFGQLDGPARAEFESRLATDRDASRTVEHLTRSLHTLLDDGLTYDPPTGLARRTALLVAETANRKRSILDFVPVVVPFRAADVAVAAGIFVAGLLTLLPAVSKSREKMDIAGCTYNLQQLGRALWQYGSRHNHYPFGPEHNSAAPTGSFVSMLNDSGLLQDSDIRSLDCPCAGKHRERTRRSLPDFTTACKLAEQNPELATEAVRTDYAYNVGHYESSKMRQVVPVKAHLAAMVPLLADQPEHVNFRSLAPGNSPNHAGRGQNVLYTDLHVGWHNSRRLGPRDPDMYLNDEQQLAPGMDDDDNVLLPSMVPFLGWRR